MLHVLTSLFFLAVLIGMARMIVDMVREAAAHVPTTLRTDRARRGRRPQPVAQRRQPRAVRLIPARIPA